MISSLTRAVEKIRQADAVFIIAGAGMSADSVLLTFRGANGLYQTEDVDIEDLINPIWFRKDPEAAWSYYRVRFGSIYLQSITKVTSI
ncbi:MAG: hypothetical protein H6998_20700 [Hahellaceae bacterium]|jgi:NAD-dependent SIR2 family protein deacetylase|nr:hypothetical protein [Hahellaceae bacterium]